MAVEEVAPENFPVGLRVLVVDDDPTCLTLMGRLLRKCEYDVTMTSQATDALKMLRAKKFDIVISDVHMPDMDGFKLLELVGLELDLPVIMLSANDDPKLVMKGIKHGAVDYLLKPARIEELKNIWQHVVRKKSLTDRGKAEDADNNSGRGPVSTEVVAQDEHLSGKRKGRDVESEENGSDSSSHENEDSGTQKKPRVIWSQELHEKFLAAVHELGIDRAFPKKILDRMNVEGLTRENVASHLQKYRIYLRKCNEGSNQQMNMTNALVGKGFFDSFGVKHSLADPGKTRGVPSLTPSYQPGGILGRLNSAPCLTLRSLASNPSPLLQTRTARGLTINNSPVCLSANQNVSSLLHGIPLQQLHQFQQNKGGATAVPGFKPANACVSGDLASLRMPTNNASNSLISCVNTRILNNNASSAILNPPSNSMVLNGCYSSYNIPSRSIDPMSGFGGGSSNSSSSGANLLDHQDQYNRCWPSALQSDPLDNTLARVVSPIEKYKEQNLAGPGELPQWQEHGSSSDGVVYSSTGHSMAPADESFVQNGAGSAYTAKNDESVGLSDVVGPSSLFLPNEVHNSDRNSEIGLEDPLLQEDTRHLLESFTGSDYESLQDISLFSLL